MRRNRLSFGQKAALALLMGSLIWPDAGMAFAGNRRPEPGREYLASEKEGDFGQKKGTPSQLEESARRAEETAPAATSSVLTENAPAAPSAVPVENAPAAPSAVPVENVPAATSSVLMQETALTASLGDLWDGWEADFSFLDGSQGEGTRRKPYQIRTRAQLMGLSQLAAMSMTVDPGNEPYVGNYEDAYFELTADLDLGGMEWIPIGYYRDSSEFAGENPHPFCAHFDGNGHTVSNFRLNHADWPGTGFFGALDSAEVTDLFLRPGKTVTGSRSVGILAGSCVDSRIYNCRVQGDARGSGRVGGLTGLLEASVAENVTALVTLDVAAGSERLAGGIAGEAARGSAVVDCRVETGDNRTARIQGTDATVGGIVGLQNDADLYNVYVSGTVGGAGSRRVGGVTGERVAGDLKVARFEGTIGQSGTGAAGYRGTFIGFREESAYFRYGEDVAYLFADSEQKIAANVCGSGIPDDNEYTYGAHIGFSHGGDNFYTLVQGGVTRTEDARYYYEELEDGIFSILDGELGGETDAEKIGYDLDHFAPNDAGRPVRGYLVTIPQIDTVSGGRNYYDVAVLEARGSGPYYRTLDKERRGAIEPGTVVTVTTAAKNTQEAKYQLDGAPTYTEGGKRRETAYQKGGEYSFVMPQENTELSARYRKVAVSVTTVPAVVKLHVTEERTGDRKNPSKVTRVTDDNGHLIATYINGELEQGTQVQPVSVGAVVDTANDVEDASVRWSVDDADLIALLPNGDEDEQGYTLKSASIRLNLDSAFFADTIRKLEEEQKKTDYQYAIPSTIYGAGHQNGGVAILTASTRPSASFEGKECKANARIEVTFQIRDRTYVAAEHASLNQGTLEFTVTRRLSGNRLHPQEQIEVTAPQALTAGFSPSFFDQKEISWSVSDPAVIRADADGRSASVSAVADTGWIRDLIAADAGNQKNDPYRKQTASGNRSAVVTVLGEDMLGNRRTASCEGTVFFETVDETTVYAEKLEADPAEISWELKLEKTGPRSRPTLTWTGAEAKKLTVCVLPEQTSNRAVSFEESDESLRVSEDGTAEVNLDAGWIRELDARSLQQGTHRAVITVRSEDGGCARQIPVVLSCEITDRTYRRSSSSGGSSGGSSGSSSGGSGGGSPGGPVSGTSGSAAVGPAAAGPAGGVTGEWTLDPAFGVWRFQSAGRLYRNEWAYICNPYANTAAGQPAADWFRFDAEGHMVTGWYTDTDGNLYYLWPQSDGSQGHMLTGWHWLPGPDGMRRRYYFNEISDGTRGRLYRDGTAPDGSRVDADGAWTVDGVVQVMSPDVKG